MLNYDHYQIEILYLSLSYNIYKCRKSERYEKTYNPEYPLYYETDCRVNKSLFICSCPLCD